MWLKLRAQALQAGFDQPMFQISGFESELVRLAFPFPSPCREIARNRYASDDGVNQQVPIEPLQKKLRHTRRRLGSAQGAGY